MFCARFVHIVFRPVLVDHNKIWKSSIFLVYLVVFLSREMLRNLIGVLVLVLAFVSTLATVKVDQASHAFKDEHQR